MKKTLVLTGVLVALAWGLSFGALQPYVAKYYGNPRLSAAPDVVPVRSHGLGPSSFPGTAVFLDSSANQNGIYVNRGLYGTSSDGDLIVGKIIRQMVPGSGWLENFTWTNGGEPPGTFVADANINGENTGRYPYSEFNAPNTYGCVTAATVIAGAFDAPKYIRNSGGYGTSLWDTPVVIRPAGEAYQNAHAVWLGAPWFGNICVPMEAASGLIPLNSEVIDTLGNIVSPLQTIFDASGGTQDYRDGKIVCFGGGPTDGMNLKTSTDGGVTWAPDSVTIWAAGTDTGFYDYADVIRQDGSVGVLATLDNVNHTQGQHAALQFFIKGHLNKATIFSPGPGQACEWPVIGRLDDNSLVATFMYVESGFDSVAWSTGKTYWDIGESHSNDGGLTWSPVTNLTNTPSVSECCPQMGRHIGINDALHITYGTSTPGDTVVDILWGILGPGALANRTYNWYLGGITGVEQQPSTAKLPARYELAEARPNPFGHNTAIQFSLPAAGDVNLSVYNVAGQMVKTLVSGRQGAGVHTAQWDGSNVPAGVYFYRLNTGSFTQTRTMVVVR